MKLSDLETGMMVVLENKVRAIVFKNLSNSMQDSVIYKDGFDYLCSWDDDFSHKNNKSIVEVYKPLNQCVIYRFYKEHYESTWWDLVWSKDSKEENEFLVKINEIQSQIDNLRKQLTDK